MILFKRPVITILFLYVLFILFADYTGMFSAEKRSVFADYAGAKNTITGKIISEPYSKNNRKQFTLLSYSINGFPAKEKIMVYADTLPDIKYGDLLELNGKIQIPPKPAFPGNFDYSKYLSRQNIYTLLYASDIKITGADPAFIKKIALAAKNDVSGKFKSFFKQPYSSVLEAMFIGEKSSIDDDTKNIFINTGLIHILVVSGMNVGFCVIIFLFLFKLFRLPMKYVYLLTIPVIFFYTIMTGANPPVVRASIMALCILISLIIDREPLVYNAMALSALIILIFNPQELFTASFQMSFTATLGIIYLYPKINSCLGKIKNKYLRWFWNVVSVTFAAQAGILPVLMFYFGKLSLISFLANILIVPAVGFIVALSFMFYAAAFISQWIALFFSILLSGVINIMLSLIRFMADFHFSMIYVKIPSVTAIIFYYFALITMLEFSRSKKILAGLCLLIAAAAILSFRNPDFTETFETQKNITTHIKQKNTNIIIFKQLKKDKYYFSNLNQYLHGRGIDKIDQFCTNSKEDIKTNMPDMEITEVLYSD